MEKWVNQVKDYTQIYSISSAVSKAKSYVYSYSEVEIKVREATSNDKWGASTTVMNEIAQATYQYNHLHDVMETIYKRLQEKTGTQWRQVYKALQLLEFIIKNGSERVVDIARDRIYEVKAMKEFHFIDDKGRDQGVNIRRRAKEIQELLQDTERIKEERKKAKENKAKFVGVQGGINGGSGIRSSSSHNDFSSNSFSDYNGSSSPNRYSDYGPSSSGSRFKDDSSDVTVKKATQNSVKKVEKQVDLLDLDSWDEPISQPSSVSANETLSQPKIISPIDNGLNLAIPAPSHTSNISKPPQSSGNNNITFSSLIGNPPNSSTNSKPPAGTNSKPLSPPIGTNSISNNLAGPPGTIKPVSGPNYNINLSSLQTESVFGNVPEPKLESPINNLSTSSLPISSPNSVRNSIINENNVQLQPENNIVPSISPSNTSISSQLPLPNSASTSTPTPISQPVKPKTLSLALPTAASINNSLYSNDNKSFTSNSDIVTSAQTISNVGNNINNNEIKDLSNGFNSLNLSGSNLLSNPIKTTVPTSTAPVLNNDTWGSFGNDDFGGFGVSHTTTSSIAPISSNINPITTTNNFGNSFDYSSNSGFGINTTKETKSNSNGAALNFDSLETSPWAD